jgi:hypothetical protein
LGGKGRSKQELGNEFKIPHSPLEKRGEEEAVLALRVLD